MPKYTTGELAKKCNITVRTVQYYDTQDIVKPTELTDGGRRIYSNDDLKKMRIVCSLRKLGLSLDTIKKIFKEENSKEVIAQLFKEQLKVVDKEIAENQDKKSELEQIIKSISSQQDFTVNSITDITLTMQNKKLKKFYIKMIGIGILCDIVEVLTILLWIFKGIWWPFAVSMVIIIGVVTLLVKSYYKKVVYICPKCQATFKPTMKEFLFSAHTPKTRKLTCTECSYHGYCVETAVED